MVSVLIWIYYFSYILASCQYGFFSYTECYLKPILDKQKNSEHKTKKNRSSFSIIEYVSMFAWITWAKIKQNKNKKFSYL
jgi:hypothetical protein